MVIFLIVIYILSFFWALSGPLSTWRSMFSHLEKSNLLSFSLIPPFDSLSGTPFDQILKFLGWLSFLFFFYLLAHITHFSPFCFTVWDFSSVTFSVLLRFLFQHFDFSRDHLCLSSSPCCSLLPPPPFSSRILFLFIDAISLLLFLKII